MKRNLKVLAVIIGVIVGLIGCFVGCLTIYNTGQLKKEKAILKTPYGEMIEVDGKKMCVKKVGEGDEVIVLSPGFGSISPVLEMKSLVNGLKEQYTVVIVEPFGYGMSEKTNKARTIENITEELHTAVQKLGYKKYWLMGHSIAGIYDLYYANQYADEVSGYVSIDGAMPKQNLEDEGSVLQYELLSIMNKTGIYRFLAEHDSEGIVPTIKGSELTEEETKQYKALAYANFMSDGIIDEFKQAKENFSRVEPLKFPATCPVLTFLSRENCKATPNWQKLHDELVTMETKDQDIILEGTHYLHYEYGEEMATRLKEWRQKNSL